ncbi:MAG: pyruvate dehydrogenase (acetyl-transferring) E1 component subunit alpha [Gemmatimonadetes bacterium]|nr:pyruvate dehydrogenase (acetyl-transferring) E1 component subunit alpha [Gemmatimonadota bacterium]
MAETRTRKTGSGEKGTGGGGAGHLHGFSKEQLHRFLREMLLYRRFEEKAEEAYAIAKIGGFCHLHIGQEAVALGFVGPLRRDDYVLTSYRDHTQALAKGVDPKAVMAELYGKSSGAARGKGGSMHMFGAELGFMGGHGIVGGQIPLATGMGWAIRYRGGDQVCVCFLGDAAVNQGAFGESLNLAAIWKLPVIYVVENNEYGMGTAFHRVSALPVGERARGSGVPSHSVNGQDVLACWSLAEELVAEVRRGAGPQYVDARTYRFKGHSMSDPVSGTYRSKEEVESKKEKEDPITVLRDRLFGNDLLTQEELEAIDREVAQAVEEAAAFADASSLPSPDDLHTQVYSKINEHGRLFFDGLAG